MFLLDDSDLTAGPILDCPGGASPFGAQVRARGGTVISVDPVYRLTRDQVLARARQNLNGAPGWLADHAGALNWAYLGSTDAHVRAWEVALDLFAADFAVDDQRYVAAALPTLPFPTGHFQLAVSGNLLFVYRDHLTFDDHVAALSELARVTRGEVRVHPLVDATGAPYPRLADVCAALRDRGVRTEIRTARRAWIVGGDQTLVCARTGTVG